MSGTITYDTAVSASDPNPPISGVPLLYPGAITLFTIESELLTQSVSSADIYVWDDVGSDEDFLSFIWDERGDYLNLAFWGLDQTMLTSAALPEKLPTEGMFRIDVFAQVDGVFIASNGVSILRSSGSEPSPIPEPLSLGLLGLGLLCWPRGKWTRALVVR